VHWFMKWFAVFLMVSGVAHMHLQVQAQTQTQTLIAPQATTPALNDRVRLDDLKGLFIDKTEVTIAQFARYAKATGVQTRAEKEGGGFEYVAGWQRRAGWTWQRPDGVPPSSQDLPAVHLTFAEAQAYCQWAQGRLPTASEWQRAGFTDLRRDPPAPWVRGKTYAWHTGDSPQGANTSDPDPWPRAAPVTQTKAGVNGLHDMGANVWEWASDARGDERRTMGGSWWYPAYQMKADVEAWKPADFYAVYIGFRCVYEK
jgi:formylglycine-generating enzyme required for sulfatase activity